MQACSCCRLAGTKLVAPLSLALPRDNSWLGTAGDHLYRMNYQDFVNKHRVTGADITVAALPTDEKKASAFGLMKIDDSGRILDFAEKPEGEALRAMQVDTSVLGLDPERSVALSFVSTPGG